jgi:hypothetical protein
MPDNVGLPLRWHGNYRGGYLVTLGEFRLLVTRAEERWAWSVTRPGEVPYRSPDGLNYSSSAAEAKQAAERAAVKRTVMKIREQ